MDNERNLIKNNLAKIRNKYLLQSIFKIVPESQLFQIIKYNKRKLNHKKCLKKEKLFKIRRTISK